MAGKREKPARAGAGAKQQAEPKAQKAPKDPKKPKGLKEPKEPKEPKAPKAPVATGDFPRGGATGLTPLEFREVARRAENEVLFSDGVTDGQAGKKRRPQDAEDGPKTRKKKTKAAKAGTAVEATASNNDDDDERASPVESLSLKRLTEGALVLGCVAAIRDLELSVSLPNGLVGTVPITSISPELTALVEKAAEAAADSDDDDDDAMDVDGGDKDDPLDLHRRFFVGQFVKCAVASVTDGKSAAAGKKGKPRPRLELTLMPEEINRRIDPDDLCEGMVLSASVRSVEDRGYVLNTGLPGEKVAAFLPTGAAQAWIDRWMPHAAELRPGQLVEAAVVSVSSDRRALRLTIDPAAVSQAEVKEPFKTMASAQPGHLVSATVVKTWDRGLSLRFMGFYDCSADLTNIDMPAARDQTEVEARYSPGDAVQVRILYVSLTAAGKVITVSAKPHVLALKPRPGLTGYELPAAARLADPSLQDAGDDDSAGSSATAGADAGMWPIPYGTVLEDCTVASVAGSAGLVLRIAATDAVYAFAAAAQLVDEDQAAPTLHKHAGAFCIGTHHRARVVGYDAIDATVRVTLRPSIVDEQLFTIHDVSPGIAVGGTVKSYNEHGAEVALSPTLTGFLHKEDMSDTALKHPELLFTVGKQIKCRVLKVAHDKRRILLTTRKSLVQSKLPAVTGYTEAEGAVPGALALGIVTRAVGGGVLASFYQGARALVVAEGAAPPVGKAIKCRILTSDPATRRMKATTNVDPAAALEDLLAKSAPAGAQSYASDTSLVSAGQIVGGTAVQVGESSITLVLDGSSLRAVLPISHLSDHGSAVTARMAARVAAGTRFDSLVVTKPAPERSLVMVSAKPALVKAAAAGRTLASAAEATTGTTLVGWIQGLTSFGAFVAFPGDLTALAPLEQLSDQYISTPEDSFFVGQTVVAVVTSVEDLPDGRRLRVSLKNSVASVAATGCLDPASFLLTYFDELEGLADAAPLAEIGQQTTVRVKQKHSYGVVVAPTATQGAIPANASGFVTADQAKDAIDKCKPDAALAACVLDVDVEKSIVDYSLRTALVAGGTGKAGRATAHAALARALAEGRETQAVVEVVKEDYLVLSLPLLGNAIAFAVAKSFNDRSKPFMRFKVGQRLSGSLVRAEPNRRALVLLRPAPTAPARTGSAGSSADKRAAKDPVDPAISFFEDFQPGLVTQARVQSIKGVQANLDLAANIKGRLHITELVDGPIDAAVASPADAFAAAGVRAGETVQVKVLGWHDAKVYKYLPITHRASPMKTVIETTIRPAALAADGAPPALSLKTIKPGQVFNGFVKGIREQAAKGWTEVQVVLGPALVGHLPIQAATSSHAVAANPGRYFVAGTSIEVQVASVDVDKKAIHLVPHGRYTREVAPPPGSAAQLVRGARVLAVVGKIVPDAMLVTVGMVVRPAGDEGSVPQLLRIKGRVDAFDAADTLAEKPFAGFAEGQPVEAVVVEDPAGDDLEKTRLRLSVRPSAVSPDTVPASSIVDPVIESAADLGVGQVVHGFVRQTTERGCFVALGRSMCARALISELSDEYVRDVKAAFPAGKFVTAVVTGVDAAANHAALSLRASKVGTAVGPDGTPKRRLELVAVGEVLKGTVTRIEDYGLFVRPDDVFTTGLCYVREIADSEVPANPRALYEIGDRVLAKVLKVDLDKDRLSLGLKSSYFADDAAAGSDSEAAGESGEESADEEDELSAGEHSGSEEIGSEDSDSEDAESDDESDSDSEESEQGSDSDTEANDLALAVAGGFRWNDDDEDAEAGAGESADSGSDDDASGDEDGAARRKAKKHGAAQRVAQDITADLAEQAPQTANDFERLVLGSPSSSFVWIQFMTFYLSQSEVDQARRIAERALNTISVREEQERMNVWMALLNLEHRFGTSETLAAVLQRAVRFMNAKHVYLQAAKMHEQADQPAEAEQMHKVAASKFAGSCKVWVQYGLFLLKAGRVADSRDLLARALRALPARKHVKTITQFGQMEFKHGEPERGRTVFEGVLGTYPRRVDLWSVYLDMEVTAGSRLPADEHDWAPVRNLFERVTAMKHTPRKMKFFFKKWLQFERDHGDDATAEHVKRRAREYVSTLGA